MENYELVSEWGSIYRNGNKAIKIYSPDKPYDYVAEKARIQALAYNAGLSVPAVNGVKTSTSYILHFFAFITLTCKKQRKN